MQRKLINSSYVCTALLSLLFFLFAISLAEANTTYKIRKGDNLYKIAKKFRVPVAELKEANNLESSDLSVGRKLVIPGKDKTGRSKHHAKKETASEDKTAKEEKSETEEKLSAPGEKQAASLKDSDAPVYLENRYHTVRKKDTIAKIARRYGLSVAELKELNNLKGSKLKTGRKLIVGRSSTESDSARASAQAKRVNVPEKIAEVKALSQSDELSNLSVNERLILFAKKMINLPYKFGGNGIFGLDCSSFVQKVYGFVGQPLPRSAREQYKIGESIDKDDLQTGDLLFFRTYASFPSHVGIYIGNNLFIHASSRSKRVQIDNLDMPYYVKRFIGAKRLLSETDAAVTEIKAAEAIKP